MQIDLFHRLAVLLEQAAIPYMLTGSFASSVYGMKRGSADIDLIIAADEQRLTELINLLPANDFYSDLESALEACRRKSMFNLIDNRIGLKIDFIFLKDRHFSQEEFQRRRERVVEGVQFWVAAPEDVIISKLEWAKMGASDRQIEDVAGILKVRKEQLDFPYIERWVREFDLDSQWAEARRQADIS